MASGTAFCSRIPMAAARLSWRRWLVRIRPCLEPERTSRGHPMESRLRLSRPRQGVAAEASGDPMIITRYLYKPDCGRRNDALQRQSTPALFPR